MNTIYCILSFVDLSFIFAYDDLSYNKVATQSHTSTGTSYLYEASNAVDGNTATCMRTRPIGRVNPDKTVWWKVDLGGVYSIYSINILFKNYDGYELRQRGRFAGFSLYVSNTGVIEGSTLSYKDGPQLPSLNFTTYTMYGRYVIFYNERSDGVIYPEGYQTTSVFTELCEVILNGCKMPRMYGSFCNKTCPRNCKEAVCHVQKGDCFTCNPGWTGATCSNECTDGWYGLNCSQLCVGHCRDDAACNHVTGQCEGGCDAGWTGSLCEKECDDGIYGYNCVNNCSGHCINNSPCNKQTGQCDKGCNPGYTNSNCNKECLPGQFGLDCKERCSGHCLNNEPCDHVSGVCSKGCQDGYTGTLCNNPCKEGHYGRNCSLVCSPNCKICRRTDGLCACKAGWSGSRCTEECIRSYGENCQYQCNTNCINLICDRFNGTCLFGCLNGRTCDLASQQNAEIENDGISCTAWIIAFSIALVIIIILIIATIRLWRTSIKRNSNAGCVQSGRMPASGETQVGLSDGVSHYQELSVSKEHNTYQTLTL